MALFLTIDALGLRIPVISINLSLTLRQWPELRVLVYSNVIPATTLATSALSGTSCQLVGGENEDTLTSLFPEPSYMVLPEEQEGQLAYHWGIVAYQQAANNTLWLSLRLNSLENAWHFSRNREQGTLLQLQHNEKEGVIAESLSAIATWLLPNLNHDEDLRSVFKPYSIFLRPPYRSEAKAMDGLLSVMGATGLWATWVPKFSGNYWKASLRFSELGELPHFSQDTLNGAHFSIDTGHALGCLEYNTDQPDAPLSDWILALFQQDWSGIPQVPECFNQLPAAFLWEDNEYPQYCVDKVTLVYYFEGSNNQMTLKAQVKPLPGFAIHSQEVRQIEMEIGAWCEEDATLREIKTLDPYQAADEQPLYARLCVPGYTREQEAGFYPVYQPGDRVLVQLQSGEAPVIIGALQQKRSALEEQGGIHVQAALGLGLLVEASKPEALPEKHLLLKEAGDAVILKTAANLTIQAKDKIVQEAGDSVTIQTDTIKLNGKTVDLAGKVKVE